MERSRRGKRRAVKTALLGLGLDGKDGHKRITRGENFLLLGGSQDTHEQMQDRAIKFNERLADHGKRIDELTPAELLDLARAIGM